MKKIKFFYPVLLLFIASSCSYIEMILPVKNKTSWSNTYGGSANELASKMLVLKDGFYLAGYTASYTNDVKSGNKGEYDFWVVRTDSVGRVLWQKSYGGRNSEYLLSASQLNDGSFLLMGASNSDDRWVSGNHGLFDGWVVKTSKYGTSKWKKSYGGSNNDYIYDALEKSNGNLVFVGYTQSSDGDITSYRNDSIEAWIFETDADGNLQWEKTYGGTLHENFSRIISDNNGGYWLGGTTGSNDGDIKSGNHGGNDMWIVHVDQDGNLLSEKTYGGTGAEAFYDMLLTVSGNLIIGGSSASSDGDVKSGNKGGEDFWVAEIETSGNIVWENSYGGSKVDLLRDIEPVSGGYQFGGYTSSLDGDVTATRSDLADAWVVRIDTEGNVLSNYCFGGTGEDRAFTIKPLSGNRVVLGGTTTSTDASITTLNYGGYDDWLMMKDSIQ